jgi:hypothetical protein
MADHFEKEIKMLNSLYSEIAEAITNKPSTQDYENSRIYFENVAARMNGWAAQVKDVKNSLENREPVKDLTADNRPA